jgi:dihydrofolate synthase/folylpolyglutamate synthase
MADPGHGDAGDAGRARHLSATLARLYALAPRGARFGLDAMREACAREGDPQRALRVVHVAGTNGKGSVAASLASIARAAGLRTGLYTSPHLLRFAERIQLDGAPVDDARLDAALARVMDAHPSLTFFEVATLAAFQLFAETPLDLVVLEVGLGGRLDATNVIDAPLASAITSIGIDHTAFLGDTIEAIAWEKAGILKPSVPLVCGPLPAAAAQVIEARASNVGAAPVWRVGRELHHERRGGHLVITGPRGRSVVAEPALAGAHQEDNATVAAALAWLVRLAEVGEGLDGRLPIEDVAIARGLAQVSWPGRLETIRIERGQLAGNYLLDGAHNEQGIAALVAALDARPESAGARALIFGAMADKVWAPMLGPLLPRAGTRVYVEPQASGGGRRATPTDAYAGLDPHGRRAVHLADALMQARACVGRDGLVVVAGSLYLVGEARGVLLGAPRDPQVGL